MEGIVQNGESVYGFAKIPQKKTASQPSKEETRKRAPIRSSRQFSVKTL